MQIPKDFSKIAREDKIFSLNLFSMLLNAGVKLYGFINHLQSGYLPFPSKRGRTLKLSMVSSILFCSALRNSEECFDTLELYMLHEKPVATSRKNKLPLQPLRY